MKSILKRIAPAKRRLRRMIENDENIREGDLRVVFQPVKGTFCVAQQFSWQPLSEFTSLGLNLIVSVYPPEYDDEE